MSPIGERRTYVMQNTAVGDTIRYDVENCRPILIDCERTYPPVLTKRDFYRRFCAGEFGNHSPTWSTLDEYQQSRYDKPIAIRTFRQGSRCDYMIPQDQVVDRYHSFLADGYAPNELNYSAQCPEEDKLLQGEVCQSPRGLEFFGSTSLEPMRVALTTAGFRCHGLTAHSWIKTHMCPNSWEWLQILLSRYPGHVIEFTTLRYNWGVLPRFNTLFWETRFYLVPLLVSLSTAAWSV